MREAQCYCPHCTGSALTVPTNRDAFSTECQPADALKQTEGDNPTANHEQGRRANARNEPTPRTRSEYPSGSSTSHTHIRRGRRFLFTKYELDEFHGGGRAKPPPRGARHSAGMVRHDVTRCPAVARGQTATRSY
jgi:hypothetical protein